MGISDILFALVSARVIALRDSLGALGWVGDRWVPQTLKHWKLAICFKLETHKKYILRPKLNKKQQTETDGRIVSWNSHSPELNLISSASSFCSLWKLQPSTMIMYYLIIPFSTTSPLVLYHTSCYKQIPPVSKTDVKIHPNGFNGLAFGFQAAARGIAFKEWTYNLENTHQLTWPWCVLCLFFWSRQDDEPLGNDPVLYYYISWGQSWFIPPVQMQKKEWECYEWDNDGRLWGEEP